MNPNGALVPGTILVAALVRARSSLILVPLSRPVYLGSLLFYRNRANPKLVPVYPDQGSFLISHPRRSLSGTSLIP